MKNKNLLKASKILMIIVIVSQIILSIANIFIYTAANGVPFIYQQILFVLGSLSSLLFYIVILILIIYFIQKEH